MPIDPRRIISEVIDNGLANERDRLGDAARCFDFFRGNFEAYPTREESWYYKRRDRRRTRRIMRRIIEVVTEGDYKKPPARRLAAGDEATAWLDRCYKAAGMAALWPRADRYSHVAGACAIEFFGVADPETIVSARLWSAADLVVWCEPFDPTVPAAVGVIDAHDATYRLRVWTPLELLTFERRKAPSPAEADRQWRLVGQEANPYGVLPFAFVHLELPAGDFWEGRELGDFLAHLNDNLNGQLDDIGDNTRFGITPTPVAKDVAPDQDLPGQLKPGQWLRLKAAIESLMGETPPDPRLEFVTPPSEYVGVAWDDMNRYLNAALEDCGIPPGAIRLEGDANAESGVAILIQSGPLVKRAEVRRQDLATFENAAARVAAAVAAGHLRAFAHAVPAWLDATAADPTPLALKWPPLYVQLPGAERDRGDSWRLANGIADVVDLLQERDDLTTDEAWEKLRQLRDRRDKLAQLGFGPAVTAALGNPAGPAPAPAPAVRDDALDVTPQTAE